MQRGFSTVLAFIVVACGSSSTGTGGSQSSAECQSACSHAAGVCPGQFHDTAKCESGCSQVSPGKIACLNAENSCDFLQRCVGEGGSTATGGGATDAQCNDACAHAAQVCPAQFSDMAKCTGACPQTSPGQAACLMLEATCDLLVACVGE